MKYNLTSKLLLPTLLVFAPSLFAGHVEITNHTSVPIVVNCSSTAPINISPNYSSAVMYHHPGAIHCMAMSSGSMVDSRNFQFATNGNENYKWYVMKQQHSHSGEVAPSSSMHSGQVVSQTPVQSGQVMSPTPIPIPVHTGQVVSQTPIYSGQVISHTIQ